MTIWGLAGVIAVAGALGGVAAALLSEDKGFVLPKKIDNASSGTIYRPGFVGLIFVGALAAVVSWGLYGPLANANIVGGEQTGKPARHDYGLTLAGLSGAIVVGLGGSKWLSSQVDKTLLKDAAVTAAARKPDTAKSRAMRKARPSELVRLANQLPE